MPTPALSADQVEHFRREGYLVGLPTLFSPDELGQMEAGLASLLALLKPGEDSRVIREWHETSRFLYDICMHPRLLDHVESLLGPDFYLWASNFFIKEPHTSGTVGWHQDAYYWPLSPHETVTAWIAFTDSDAENGAMQVVPRSHHAGLLRHIRSSETDSVLTLECDTAQFREDEAIPLELPAGGFSLHDDKLVHGSPANHSSRPRVGLTARYSTTRVKCDLSVNPHFKTYLCRGEDVYQHNPVGTVPAEAFARLDREHRNVEDAGDEAERKLGLKK